MTNSERLNATTSHQISAMPRPTAKTDYFPFCWIGELPIADERFEELVEICCVRREQRADFKRAIQGSLNQYHALREVVDNVPRPTHVREALKPVSKYALSLKQAISGLDAMSAYRLLEVGFQADAMGGRGRELVQLLDELLAAVSKVRESLEDTESRGGHTNVALQNAVQALGRVFAHFARVELDPVEGEPPLRPERLRLDFVELVLISVNENLPRPAYDPDLDLTLPPYTLDPIEYPSRDRLARLLAELDKPSS
jgi:hypothetical protein